MSHNRITIYSNGIADFQKRLQVTAGKPLQLSIPVRKNHVGDLLATFNLFGDVQLLEPPCFTPQNQTAGTLNINTNDALQELVQSLSGSQVVITQPAGEMEGLLCGLHREQQGTAGEPVKVVYLVLQSGGSIKKIALKEIEALRFCDVDVQKEIDKALKRNAERIKPESTFVDLTIGTEAAEAEAVLQYALPAAAWKISYRIMQQPDGKTQFLGFAIVDNNTDEEWNDVLISVVTGEPITFSTDIAESKIPRREHVNIVAESALGAVEIEGEMLAMSVSADYSEEQMDDAVYGGAPGRMLAKRSRKAKMQMADMSTAEAEGVGDFNIFHAELPVTIPAQRSTTVPVLQGVLDDAKTVLHYRFADHATRPFRCVEFQNPLEFGLGRGVCAVYDAETYVGSCILPATKPAQTALLAHALETSVKIQQRVERQRSSQVGLYVKQGTCVESSHLEQETRYELNNSSGNDYQLILDHDRLLHNSTVECFSINSQGAETPLPFDKTGEQGIRIRTSLTSHAADTIRVREQLVVKSNIALLNQDASGWRLNRQWLQANVFKANGPLTKHEGIKECIAIQQRIDDKQQEISNAEQEAEAITTRQERLRKNLTAIGENEQANKWRVDLMNTEERLVELEEEVLPELRAAQQVITRELQTAVKTLQADWSAGG